MKMTKKMMMKSCFNFFLILFLSHSVNSFAQDKANFYADTAHLYGKWRTNPYEGFMKWTIQGKSFGWGETISVDVTPNQLDTVFFQKSPESTVDTIICDIREARSYKFLHNACCGGFNVRQNDKNKITDEIIFILSQKVSDSTIVGTIAETGSFIKGKKTQKMSSICSSAMASNISPVSLGEVTNCGEIEDCIGWMCFYTKGDEDSYSDDLGFKKTYFNFLYMPLNDKPQKMYYNIKNQSLKFSH